MTPEQKAAYVNAQAALLTAKIVAMVAANQERIDKGFSQAYSEASFDELIREFENASLGHNAVLTLFER
jgi:hypothetical protein